jgi:hypothetical protein
VSAEGYARSVARGSQWSALWRLADDSFGDQDAAGDGRDADDTWIAALDAGRTGSKFERLHSPYTIEAGFEDALATVYLRMENRAGRFSIFNAVFG